MHHHRLIQLVMACLLVAPAALAAVDLSIESVEVVSYREYALTVEVIFNLKNVGSDDDLDTDLTVFLDGDSAKTVPVNVGIESGSDCAGDYPYCEGECLDVYSDDVAYPGYCLPEESGPQGPTCACAYAISQMILEVPYDGEDQLQVVIDHMNTIWEWDETNNDQIVPVPPVAVAATSWSTVRALFR